MNCNITGCQRVRPEPDARRADFGAKTRQEFLSLRLSESLLVAGEEVKELYTCEVEKVTVGRPELMEKGLCIAQVKRDGKNSSNSNLALAFNYRPGSRMASVVVSDRNELGVKEYKDEGGTLRFAAHSKDLGTTGKWFVTEAEMNRVDMTATFSYYSRGNVQGGRLRTLSGTFSCTIVK